MKHREKDRSARARGQSPPVDPDDFFSDYQRPKLNFKTLSLCKQAMRALSTALAGECADPILQSLQVLQVDPAPGPGRLMVTVQRPHHAPMSPTEVILQLEQVRGLLRAAVAQTICRKRAPDIVFLVLRAPEVQP